MTSASEPTIKQDHRSAVGSGKLAISLQDYLLRRCQLRRLIRQQMQAVRETRRDRRELVREARESNSDEGRDDAMMFVGFTQSSRESWRHTGRGYMEEIAGLKARRILSKMVESGSLVLRP